MKANHAKRFWFVAILLVLVLLLLSLAACIEDATVLHEGVLTSITQTGDPDTWPSNIITIVTFADGAIFEIGKSSFNRPPVLQIGARYRLVRLQSGAVTLEAVP